MMLVTLDEHISALGGEEASLIKLIVSVSEGISSELPQRVGESSTFNIYGERQAEIDAWANDLFVMKLLKSGLVKEVASEELNKTLTSKHGELAVTLDPIDGSSNIKSDNLLGTIVGIYRDETLPAKGDRLVASLYVLYGPYLSMVYTARRGVYEFVKARKGMYRNRFVSNDEKIRLPKRGAVYGIGGSRTKWPPEVKIMADQLDKEGYKVRYGGALVGDFNQILHYGGFFAYPSLTDMPDGKYRLQFESNPLALIVEQAGGKASDGHKRILDIEPSDLTQRIPTYLGNTKLVTRFEKLLDK